MNLPARFRDDMQLLLEADFPDFIQALDSPQPTAIRINPLKRISPPSENKVPWCNAGYYLEQRPSFTLDPRFHAGTYYVQDASSMFLEQAFIQTAGNQSSLRVLDLCAAPGGKSTHLLGLLSRDSLLVSNEVIRSRLPLLNTNIEKWGSMNALVTCNDPADFSSLKGFFDVIIVDAPCSGEGLFRKDPDAISEWSPAHVAMCAMRQQRIIENVWPALKEHGVLIYSTCTWNQTENETNLQWLAGTKQAESIRINIQPSWGVSESVFNNIFGYRFYPHRLKGEGFFIAVFRKREKTDQLPEQRFKKEKQRTNPFDQQLLNYLINPDQYQLRFINDAVFADPVIHGQDRQLLGEFLNIVHSGVCLGEVKNNKLIPGHALALTPELNPAAFPNLNLTLEEALSYLRKDPVPGPSTKGFHTVSYENHRLGFVNVLPNRVNNLLPMSARILNK